VRKRNAMGRFLRDRYRAFLFRLTALRYRNTPAGLLVRLERLAKRQGAPRAPGESPRAFLARMDKNGRLIPLSRALDESFYGGARTTLTAVQCRTLYKAYREC